jgi:hypothetical protein
MYPSFGVLSIPLCVVYTSRCQRVNEMAAKDVHFTVRRFGNAI